MFGAEHYLFLWRNKSSHISLELGEGDNLVWWEFFPLLVDLCTQCTNELATATAKAGRNTLFTLLTLVFLRLFDFLYGITNLKEIVEVKCGLEAWNTGCGRRVDRRQLGQWRDSPWQSQTTSRSLFAKHMETLQQFRFSVGVKTDTTGELVFQFPESLFSNSGGCGHCGWNKTIKLNCGCLADDSKPQTQTHSSCNKISKADSEQVDRQCVALAIFNRKSDQSFIGVGSIPYHIWC